MPIFARSAARRLSSGLLIYAAAAQRGPFNLWTGPTVKPNQDSPSHPGEKVVLSSELEGCTVASLMDSSRYWLRNFVPPLIAPSMKVNEVLDLSEHAFTVKHVLDGAKLHAVGLGSPDGAMQDRVVRWETTEIFPKEALIRTRSFTPIVGGGVWVNQASNATVFSETFTRFSGEPVRVEQWWFVDGQRRTGQHLAGALLTVLPQIHGLSKKRLVPCQPAASLAEPGQESVVCDPMGAHISWDQMWEALRYLWADVSNFAVLLGAPAVMTKVTDEEFFIRRLDGLDLPAVGFFHVKLDRGSGRMVRHRKHAEVTLETTYHVLHRDPLVMELWSVVADGARRADRFMAAIMAYTIEKIIEANDNRANCKAGDNEAKCRLG